MEENTIWLTYAEIDDELKNQLREYYLSGDYIVPDDWFDLSYEEFIKEYPMFEINTYNIEIDTYRNVYDIPGTFDITYESLPKLSDEFLEFYDKEWVYDMMFDFHNNTFSKDFNIDTEAIYSDIESEIFPDIIEVENGKIDLSTTKFEQPLKNALIKYKNLENDDINELLERWIREIDAANIFFAETITINEDDYDLVLNELTNEMESKVEQLTEEVYDSYQPILDNFYKNFVSYFRDVYESYFTDESVDANLEYRTFEVIVDKDGKQLDIVDLNGEF